MKAAAQPQKQLEMIEINVRPLLSPGGHAGFISAVYPEIKLHVR